MLYFLLVIIMVAVFAGVSIGCTNGAAFTGCCGSKSGNSCDGCSKNISSNRKKI
ncbi:MAG: hypothetical protein ACRCTQ_06545 [Brevinemataceae bacterium]